MCIYVYIYIYIYIYIHTYTHIHTDPWRSRTCETRTSAETGIRNSHRSDAKPSLVTSSRSEVNARIVI